MSDASSIAAIGCAAVGRLQRGRSTQDGIPAVGILWQYAMPTSRTVPTSFAEGL